jgi:5'-phosphate synthase pdxT subunit
MDVDVSRNSFGRQKESFEAKLTIPAFGKAPVVGIFIRAPVIERAGDGVEVLARHDGRIVAARQGNVIGLSFHPELTGDNRIFRYFLEEIGKSGPENA